MDAKGNIFANDARKKGNSKLVNFKTMESEVIVMIECNSVVVSLLVRVVVSISTSTIMTSVSQKSYHGVLRLYRIVGVLTAQITTYRTLRGLEL